MEMIDIDSLAQVFSGSAIVRGGDDSRALRVGDLDGTGDLSSQKTLVGAPPSGAGSALRLSDVVISLRGNANNAAVVEAADVDGPPLFATLDLAIIRLRTPSRVSARYVATWLNLPATQKILAESREGTAAKRLPLGPLKALRIPLPDLRRQNAIVALAREAAEERRIASRIAELRATLFNECLAQAAIGPKEEARL